MDSRHILKISPQGQLTLRRSVRKALGDPRHMECWIDKGTLMLRPALVATVDQATSMFGKEGITRDVLVEALRIVRVRGKQGPAT
ncbi:hypothetical protein AAFN86_10620 [Roseomonas sp. CAU 1739]|uniref:hypothetical protein n=1 Tax=Roseomonas sp. CAU 1739 TaxID=3140364 RepID=UPI00325B62CF